MSAAAPQRGTTTPIVALAALLAAAVSTYQLTRPNLLFGITPDVSAWLGGSVRLLDGAVPYRDFVFTQPPGFVLLASPFALAAKWIGTRDALALLRLTAPVLGAANIVVLGRVVQHLGRIAVLVACGVLAVFPAELYALRGPMLEPFVNLLCLLGLLAAFDRGSLRRARWMLAAGAAFGLAAAVKAPALVPAVVLLVLCVSELRARLLPLSGGLIAGFGIPTLGFFVVAPGEFVRDAVVTQLGRTGLPGRTPALARLPDMLGTSNLPAAQAIAIGAAVLLVIGLVAVLTLPWTRTRIDALTAFTLIATTAVGLAQFGPAWYYPHYAAFFAAFLCLGLAVLAARLVGAQTGPALAAAGLLVGVLAVTEISALARLAVPDESATIDSVIPMHTCVLSDSPAKLVTSNRFVGPSGCSAMVDPQGTTLALGSDAKATWLDAFERSDYLVSDVPVAYWYIPHDTELTDYVRTHFRFVRRAGLVFYVRN